MICCKYIDHMVRQLLLLYNLTVVWKMGPTKETCNNAFGFGLFLAFFSIMKYFHYNSLTFKDSFIAIVFSYFFYLALFIN